MRQMLTATLIALMLSGCGQAAGLSGIKAIKPQGAQAMTRQAVEKGARAALTLAFQTMDKDQSGFLSLQEGPTQEGAAPAAEPSPEQAEAARAEIFARLDLNQDGKVTLKEYLSPERVTSFTEMVRHEAGKLFAGYDRNGDRVLVTAELVPAEGSSLPFPLDFAAADKNQNGKLTVSEFEDAMAIVFATGGGFGAKQVSAPEADEN